MNKAALSHLRFFTGTENYYRHSPRLLITDGVKFLADNADCYWLLDIIASYQPKASKDASLRDMQFWHLRPYPQPEAHAPFSVGAMLQPKIPMPKPTINTRGGILHYEKPTESGTPVAYVLCERDTDDAAIVQDIPFTDFPFDALPETTIWVQPTADSNGRVVMVAYLPSEH